MELVHNGVLFHDSFESKGFNKINGTSISLLAEQMLWMYSSYAFKEKYSKDDVFVENAWRDIKSQLPLDLQKLQFPNDFNELFLKMRAVNANLKLQKSEYNKLHKSEIDEKKKDEKEKYGYCYKNGEKTEISNPYVEDCRFFISRGNLRGSWVSSVQPEDVEINASDDVPCTLNGHHWKHIELKNVDYIAKYKINVGFGKAYIDKFVWLSVNSKDKQNDNLNKFEKARKLLLKIDDIEKQVIKDCSAKNQLKKENALITYIVLTFGIRIGNEHKNNIRDNDVRGASTLCVENMHLHETNKISLNFKGKDSILFSETYDVNPTVYNAFKKQIEGKKSTDKIYDYANSVTVNDYLKSIYDGDISIKTFRTAKCCLTLAKEIQSRNWKNLTDKEFKNNLMHCCLQTSLLLNHHKTITDEQKEKLKDSSLDKLRNAEFTMNKVIENSNKKIKNLKQAEKDFKSCLDGEFLNKKLVELELKEKEQLNKIKSARKKYEDIQKEVQFKLDSQSINLSTSLNAYSQPKLPISLCKYADKDPSIIYSKNQLKKFEWAMNVNKDYWKKYPNV